MDRVRNIGQAAALASLAGGPALMAMLGIGVLLSGEPVHVGPMDIARAAVGIWTVALFGWFFAIVPNLFGTIVLGWLGEFNIGLRLPAFWAIIGAGVGGIPMWLSAGPHDMGQAPAVMAGVGAISALLCRAKVRWDDGASHP